MARKHADAARNSTGGQQENATNSSAPTGGELAMQVRQLLDDGQNDAAFDLLVRDKISSGWMTNALGVCHLRRGSPKLAVELLRGLVLASGGIVLRRDVPAAYRTNYAAALLASGNLEGCLSVLGEMKDEEHQTISKLRNAIRAWRQRLTLLERANLALGGQPKHLPTVDFPLGDLE